MSLRDSSCYTLTLSPSKADPTVINLSETYGAGFTRDEPRYVRVTERQNEEVYSSAIYDGLTGAKLASTGYSVEKAKKRRLQLHGPDEDVPFEFTGKINFEWSFEFEGNKFRWTREVYGKDYICSIDRKPDPRVEICLARDSSSKGPARLQILHYNIDRFPDEIKDLRGLETLLVARTGPVRTTSGGKAATTLNGGSPPVPPKPVRVISQEDFEPENPNEILVSMSSDLDDHIARATNLLEDPHILFIVIRTMTAEAVQRALQVSLGITRFRHREGLPDLHQYVIEEEVLTPQRSISGTSTNGRPGPKVIKLDDDPEPVSRQSPGSSRKWAPLNIAIYLSTIELSDLKPGRRESAQSAQIPAPSPSVLPLGAGIPASTSAGPEPSKSSNSVPKKSSTLGKLFRTSS